MAEGDLCWPPDTCHFQHLAAWSGGVVPLSLLGLAQPLHMLGGMQSASLDPVTAQGGDSQEVRPPVLEEWEG